MKLIAFLILLLFFSEASFAQKSIGSEFIQFKSNYAMGFTYKYEFEESDTPWKFQWNMGVGLADGKGYYTRFPGGIPLAGYLLSSWISFTNRYPATTSDGRWGNFGVGVLCITPAILPNRITYQCYGNNNGSIGIYTEPANFVWWSSERTQDFAYFPELGIALRLKSLWLEAGGLYQYEQDAYGFKFGAAVRI
jgi:hypothetical protein